MLLGLGVVVDKSEVFKVAQRKKQPKKEAANQRSKKMMRTKCFGRGTRGFSTSSSFSLSSAVKRRWREQKSSGLWFTFVVGFCVHHYIRYQKLGQVDRIAKEQLKRSHDLSKKYRRYLNEDYDDPKPGSSKTL